MLQTVPAEYSYFLGKTCWEPWVAILPERSVDFNLGDWIFSGLFYNFSPGGRFVGYAAPTLLGELYINFGVLISMIGMFCIGSFFEIIYIHFVRSRKTDIRIAGFSIISVILGKSAIESLSDPFQVMGLIIVILMVVFTPLRLVEFSLKK